MDEVFVRREAARYRAQSDALKAALKLPQADAFWAVARALEAKHGVRFKPTEKPPVLDLEPEPQERPISAYPPPPSWEALPEEDRGILDAKADADAEGLASGEYCVFCAMPGGVCVCDAGDEMPEEGAA